MNTRSYDAEPERDLAEPWSFFGVFVVGRRAGPFFLVWAAVIAASRVLVGVTALAIWVGVVALAAWVAGHVHRDPQTR
jgi:hypothetical protein